MSEIVEKIRAELVAGGMPEVRESSRKFFKEEVLLHGLRSAQVKQLANKWWKQVKGLTKPEILAMCEEFWRSGYLEEGGVACEWSAALVNRYLPEDFELFEGWLGRYVNNWASCDVFCNHTLGGLIAMYPQLVGRLPAWTESENRWLRRGAAVSLIVPVRQGKFLPEALAIAKRLLPDPDDLVQKGYGWLLKVAADAGSDNQQAVFAFILEHKSAMPRTALRYAVEKMPAHLKKQAMQ